MKAGLPRAIAYATVVVVAAIALKYVPQLPDTRPADVLVAQEAMPSWTLAFDTLGERETLQKVFRRGGLSDSSAYLAIKAASTIDERKVKAGLPITFRTDTAETEPSEVVLELAVDKLVHLKRVDGLWTSSEERLSWTTDTIAVSGTIQSSVTAAIEASASDFLPKAARLALTDQLAGEVYGYKIDMTRELQKGDEFKVIAERQVGPKGMVRIGSIIGATFKLSGTVMKAVRFASKKVSGDYFDEEGKSMRAQFMKYPVAFSRISSTFGSRFHPILGYTRPHKGTDYAAAENTPVHAIGDGVVLRAGWDQGYGNMAEIRHPNGYVTRYGHMHSFADKIHPGTRVTMGQTIGYVGHTGLATGPHLHFEVLINGEQRNSLTAFKKSTGDPIPSLEQADFSKVASRVIADLDRVPSNRAYAMSGGSTATVTAEQQGKPH